MGYIRIHILYLLWIQSFLNGTGIDLLGVAASVDEHLACSRAHYVQEVIIGNNILFCPWKHSMDDRYNAAIDE